MYPANQFEKSKGNMKQKLESYQWCIGEKQTLLLNDTFVINGQNVEDPNEIVNEFNSYFVNIGRKLSANIE